MNFFEQLRVSQTKKNSLLCVGLDPDIDAIKNTGKIDFHRKPKRMVDDFCTKIVMETAGFASAFKPNHAFFSALDAEKALRDIIPFCQYFNVPVILDAKRNDIGNTAAAYAKEAFVRYGADAVTVNPYMGLDTIEPFLKHDGKGVIVLCRTSNPGGDDFQNLVLENGLKLYEQVAIKMAELDARYGGGRIGLVVGATCPAELTRVRELVGDMTLLVPGIGAQGGDVEATVRAGQTADGFGMVINSSRGVIYAADPIKAAEETRDQINLYRNTVSA